MTSLNLYSAMLCWFSYSEVSMSDSEITKEYQLWQVRKILWFKKMSLIFKRVMVLKSVSFAQSADLMLTDFNFQFIIQTVKPQPGLHYFQGQETLHFMPRSGWWISNVIKSSSISMEAEEVWRWYGQIVSHQIQSHLKGLINVWMCIKFEIISTWDQFSKYLHAVRGDKTDGTNQYIM